eukprot:1156318-Pelagomonas_calceolata.AAC.5
MRAPTGTYQRDPNLKGASWGTPMHGSMQKTGNFRPQLTPSAGIVVKRAKGGIRASLGPLWWKWRLGQGLSFQSLLVSTQDEPKEVASRWRSAWRTCSGWGCLLREYNGSPGASCDTCRGGSAVRLRIRGKGGQDVQSGCNRCLSSV